VRFAELQRRGRAAAVMLGLHFASSSSPESGALNPPRDRPSCSPPTTT
jgi:hypothetical protein